MNEIEVIRFLGWWELSTCLFAFMALLSIWYHLGRNKGDIGQVRLALSSCILLLGTLLLITCNSEKIEYHNHPNVIVILTDDQGWGDLGFNGNTNVKTPNIDYLASNGAIMDNFYVSPVCSPTRAEFLTGRYYPRTGVFSTSAGGERLDLDEKTIAEYFKESGYKTAAFGKWHNGSQYPYHPNGRGFDEFYGFTSGHWGNYFSPMLDHNGKIVRGKGYLPDDLTDKAISFIKGNASNPFFLYIPYNTPHSPMQVPDKWWNRLDTTSMSMKADDQYTEDIEFTKAALAMAENLDWNMGRILEVLHQLELDDNTIIVYFSDNGPNSFRWNGGMKGRKGSTDEGGVRSPLIINWPNGKIINQKIKHLSSTIDLLPTIADLANIPLSTPKPLDGKSIAPVLIHDTKTESKRMVINHWQHRVSVRSQKYRLDHNDDLYHIETDRGQSTKLNEVYPDVLSTLLKAKRFYQDSVMSELPEIDNRTFPIAHPDSKSDQLPARDGIAHGNIKRSNKYPNCSFFNNWVSIRDSISWDVEVLQSGLFNVAVYYTCKPESVGSEISFSFNDQKITKIISVDHDIGLIGANEDRIPRIESYVKDFMPLDLGEVRLSKGVGSLVLSSDQMTGTEVADIRMLLLKRLE